MLSLLKKIGAPRRDRYRSSLTFSSPRLSGDRVASSSSLYEDNAKLQSDNQWNRNPLLRLLYHMFTCSPSHICWVIFVWALPLLFTVVCTAVVLLFRAYTVPTPLPVDSDFHLFSEGRAMSLYQNMTGLDRPRAVGTFDNQVVFREALLSRLGDLDREKTNTGVRVEIMEHLFDAGMFGEPLSNVLVRLSDARRSVPTGEDANSVMISSHYDTVFSSPGGADDGIGIVTMLEMIRALLHKSPHEGTKTTNPAFPIIFMFNNGEEAGLLGAKAFVNQTDESMESYQWMKSVRRVLNIDANGRNGRVAMFRLNGGKVACEEYAVVPYPHGNVVGEEALEYIPNYTDFTAYSEIGNMIGLDFALFGDGYTYHTMHDTADTMTSGSVQQFGENLMALVNHYCFVENKEDSPLSASKQSVDTNIKYVYFDVLGLIFFYAAHSNVILFQVLLVVVSLLLPVVRFVLELIFEVAIQRRKEKHLLFLTWSERASTKALKRSLMGLLMTYLYAIGYAFSFALGLTFALSVGMVVHYFRSMVWYSSMYTALFIFSLPCILGMVIGQWIFSQCAVQACCIRFAYKSLYKRKNTITSDRRHYNKINKSIYSFTKERYLGVNVLWGVAVMIVLIAQLRSMYTITIFSACTNAFVLLMLAIEKVVLAGAFLRCNMWRLKYHSKRQILLIDDLEDDAMTIQLQEDDYDSDASDHFVVETRKEEVLDTYDDALGKLAALKRQKSFSDRLTNTVNKVSPYKSLFVMPFLKQRIFWVVVPILAGFAGTVLSIELLLSFLSMMMPNMGYQRINSDLVIAGMVAFFVSLIAVNFLPLLHRAANFLKLIFILAAITALGIFFVILFLQPFDLNHPHLLHVFQDYTATSSTTRSNPSDIKMRDKHVDVTVRSLNKKSVESSILVPYERLKKEQFTRVKDSRPDDAGYWTTVRIPKDRFERIRQLPRFEIPNISVSSIELLQHPDLKYATFNLTIESNFPSAWYSTLDVAIIEPPPNTNDPLEYIDVEFRAHDVDEARIRDITDTRKQEKSLGVTLVKRNFATNKWNVFVHGRVSHERMTDGDFRLGIAVSSAFCDSIADDSTTFVLDMLTAMPHVKVMGNAACDYMTTSAMLEVDMKQ